MLIGQLHATDVRRVQRARLATAVIFFAHGAVFGNWVSRVPAIKEHVHAGTGPLGLALLGIAVGALAARQVAGQLVARYGSRSVTRAGLALCCLTLLLPALAASAVVLGLALAGFGAALGGADVAMNAHAVAVQERVGRPIMSSFHGVYSVGGLAGALAGGRAAAANLGPLPHFSLVALVFLALVLAASSWLLPSARDTAPGSPSTGSTSKDSRSKGSTSTGGWARLPADCRLTLVLLGLVGLGAMAGEGAAGDWGAIYLHDNLGASSGFAASGFAAYCLAMAAGRFLGDAFVARWGGLRVVRWSLTFAGGGFAAALVIGNPVVAVGGFATLGIGLALVIPVVLSIAGRLAGASVAPLGGEPAGTLGGEPAGPAITIVSSLSGLGAVAAPPIIGFLAELVGLPAALGAVSVLALLAAWLVRVVGSLQKSISY